MARARYTSDLDRTSNNVCLAEDHRMLRKVRHRGTLKVDWIFTFAWAAYNLARMRNLMAATVPAQ